MCSLNRLTWKLWYCSKIGLENCDYMGFGSFGMRRSLFYDSDVKLLTPYPVDDNSLRKETGIYPLKARYHAAWNSKTLQNNQRINLLARFMAHLLVLQVSLVNTLNVLSSIDSGVNSRNLANLKESQKLIVVLLRGGLYHVQSIAHGTPLVLLIFYRNHILLEDKRFFFLYLLK